MYIDIYIYIYILYRYYINTEILHATHHIFGHFEWDPYVTAVDLAQAKNLWQKPRWSAETRLSILSDEVIFFHWGYKTQINLTIYTYICLKHFKS